MPLNVQTFFTRTGSALVFGLIMLLGLLLNTWSFILLFFVVNILCLWEYASLVESILQTHFAKNEKVNFILTGVCLYLLMLTLPLTMCHSEVSGLFSPFVFHSIGLTIGAVLVFLLFMKNKKGIYLLSGLSYITVSLGLLVQLRYHALLLPVILILLIWMNDTMAYLTGSFFGKTKFFPNISPKKTWEGTIGGIVLTLALALIWGWFTNWFSASVWISLAFIASVLGTIGDLVESKLKRMAGVKDSGSIMPGHGGALDRFDSLLFAAPFAFLLAVFCELCR